TRTPLTILRTHLEGFEDGIIDMTPEEIKTCENQIENITLIITNMSGMLDADKEIDQVKYEEFELNQLLKQVVGGLKVQFDKKNIELKLTSDKKIVMNTDKYKLSQSIYNILTNAYKFTEKNGKVTLSYGIIKEEIVISIEDTGIGMNSEDKKHIFDAYYKGSNSSKSTGEGLGLYIVKENLDKINGTIDVVSELGAGSKFTITIPM
ncbi:MAG: sensor histidine kinase, partial [Sedimentibacter sp.]